ncbi:MAG: FAD-dependent oxidoreductase [Anaerolineales bacterium]|nr:FAD-dependent oxidoreductase [Anaerolineales bacterium]
MGWRIKLANNYLFYLPSSIFYPHQITGVLDAKSSASGHHRRGITGCSIAYHLAKMGWTDVLLLDKGDLTSGSTWHAAGLVTQFHTSPTLMRDHLQRQPVPPITGRNRPYGRLARGGQLAPGLQPRPLQILAAPNRAGQSVGHGGRNDLARRSAAYFPYMSEADLYGALYIRGDGHLEPSGVTLELARQAKQMGVAMQTGVRVTGFEFGPTGEVRQVHTDHGSITTEIVVNAAGMWGRQVGAMAGVNLPITPLVHQHLTTKPIPGHELPPDTPVLRDPYHLFYLREEVRGFLIGGFEVQPQAWAVDGVPWDFTQKLFPRLGFVRPDYGGSHPADSLLAQAELMHLVNGPEGITPTAARWWDPYRAGPAFCSLRLVAHRLWRGRALGDIVAQWIVNGEPGSNVSELNVRRFGPIYEDRTYAAERARESYKYYYELRYPHDENEWARERRLSPLDGRLLKLGGVFGEKNGWERVNYFEPGRTGRRAGAEQKKWGLGQTALF